MNKLKKCKNCGDKFTQFNSFEKFCKAPECREVAKLKKKKCSVCKCSFQTKSDFQKVCFNPECVSEHIKAVGEKSKKKAAKEWRQRKKKLAEELETVSDWRKKLQTEVNRIARKIDEDKNCISCGWLSLRRGSLPCHNYDAGHYYAVGSNPEIAFHLDNIHKQCVYCNRHLHANLNGYNEGMKQRYGMDYFGAVHELRGKTPPLSLTIQDFKDKVKIARSIIKLIESGQPFTRKQANKMLGIYPELITETKE